MFSAPFTSALNAASHSLHTYQATSNALTVFLSTTHATRLTRVALGHFYDFDTLDFRLVGEYRGETVKLADVQVEVAVFTSVLRGRSRPV